MAEQTTSGSWLKPWGGRFLHYFVTHRLTLCGKELVPHAPWSLIIPAQGKCVKCQAKLDKMKETK